MSLDLLVKEVCCGNNERAVEVAQGVLRTTAPARIVEALTWGMRSLGDRFDKREIFIPELLVASEAMGAVMGVVEPHLRQEGKEGARTTCVIGTVAGDMHEIGKNLVAMFLRASGHQVIDLGCDVKPELFLEVAEQERAHVIGCSSLMTTSRMEQRHLIDLLVRKGVREKYRVIVGGAAVGDRWAKQIGADAYLPDAFAAAQYMNELAAGRSV